MERKMKIETLLEELPDNTCREIKIDSEPYIICKEHGKKRIVKLVNPNQQGAQ